MREGRPADVRVQKGGDPHDLGELVARGVPKCLDDRPLPGHPQRRQRTARARPLAHQRPARALTARVMVNRIWQHHFGKPIVPTPSDFGLRGTPANSPRTARLAGPLSSSLRAGRSRPCTRRSCSRRPTGLPPTVDRPTRPPTRGIPGTGGSTATPLDAEALRDTLLDLGGSLDSTRPGPHPFPAATAWHFTAHHQFKAVYASNHRSVYLMVQRLHPHPYLRIFNGPDTSMTTAVRDGSSVPLQALFLLNSPFVHEQSRPVRPIAP